MTLRYLKPIFAIVVLLYLAGCGGGGGGTTATTSTATTAVTRQINVPYVNITICAHGSGTAPAYSNVLPVSVDNALSSTSTVTQTQTSTQCQTIDHVLLDTGSYGLRLFASALNNPVLTSLQAETVGGNNLAECTTFANGVTWGSVRLADVYLSGETAANLPVQIMADPAFPNVPASCSSRGTLINTVQSFGAKGLLGVGTFMQDCGNSCASTPLTGYYYTCPSGTCSAVTVSLAQQVSNPVSMLATDNNGILLQLQSLPSGSAATATGSLIFGIGTQGNNALGSAVKYDLDPTTGNLTTAYTNTANTLVTFTNQAFLDSGSNALFFPDSGIPGCSASSTAPGFYCPASTLSLSATIQGSTNTRSFLVTFNVANSDTLFSNASTYAAFRDVGGPFVSSSSFDWGLPFFYGRSVFFGIETIASTGSGMYVAF